MDPIEPFVFDSPSPRVLFGPGTASQLPDELRRLGLSRPLVCSAPSRSGLAMAASVLDILRKGEIPESATISTALVHNPSQVIEDALAATASRDCLVSVGGGSAVGLGKALALRTGLPHVCLPTTYSGSEMTAILGETKDGKKTSTTDPRILPTVVIYDVLWTLDLPAQVSAASGVNAIAHSIEALYAKQSNPVSTLLALESISLLSSSLPEISRGSPSQESRSQALLGAYLAGKAVAATGIALHHKLAHAAGGTLGLPHAETHAILLPHSIAYNSAALPRHLLGRLAAALAQCGSSDGRESTAGAEDVVAGLNKLIRATHIPVALGMLGMKEEDVDRVADVAMEQPYWNPRPVEREKIREVVRRAWAGEEARVDL